MKRREKAEWEAGSFIGKEKQERGNGWKKEERA
jgi:hypothetical protein